MSMMPRIRFPLKDAVDLIIKGNANIVSTDKTVVWRDGDRILGKDSENNLSQVVDAYLGVSRWYWRAVS